MINLRKLREAAGLSQEKLGELSGLSRFAILEYEAGRRSPDIFDREEDCVGVGMFARRS